MKKFQKTVLMLALAAAVALPLASCNTMEGLGRDTKAAGDALSNAAQENKGY
jgi:predicted small secreted protein